MKGKSIFFLFSITPVFSEGSFEPSLHLQLANNHSMVMEMNRKTTLMNMAQEIHNLNNQIDQLIFKRESLKNVYEIASLLKYIDQLKKDRDQKMRELRNIRAQSFVVRKIG